MYKYLILFLLAVILCLHIPTGKLGKLKANSSKYGTPTVIAGVRG